MASSAESSERGSVKKKRLTRLGSFSSQEVFRAWANDSLLKPKTIEALIEVHQIDSLPAVLALRGKDIASLGLPIGQARLFQEAVVKLHAEFEYQEPSLSTTPVNVEVPSYKSMLDNAQSAVDHVNGKGHYFKFNHLEASEMGIEVDEIFGDGQSDKKLLYDETDGGDDDETRSGCACQRWLFISIFMPLILVLSILGCIAWLLLWPIHKCCPKTFSKIFQAAENLMKLPVISINWAIGRRRDHQPSDEFTETKKGYGGTDNVTMHEIEKTNK